MKVKVNQLSEVDDGCQDSLIECMHAVAHVGPGSVDNIDDWRQAKALGRALVLPLCGIVDHQHPVGKVRQRLPDTNDKRYDN